MSGIYIHIPFCRQACHYCDFHFSTNLKRIDDMVEAICNELKKRISYLTEPVETIYFGGGTPSLIESAKIGMMLTQIHELFDVIDDPEITLEANPEDLSLKKCQLLKQIGVNRLSIGFQTFDEDKLQWMNRAHNRLQSDAAYRNAREVGFDNISLDLMYALPEEGNTLFKNDLEQIVALKPEHISLYGLTIENRTVFGRLKEKDLLIEVPEEQAATQYLDAIRFLKDHGYLQYEVSNFGKEGHHSRHNFGYWNHLSYLGVGPGAHSYNGTSRSFNVRSNPKYMKAIQNAENYFEEEVLSETQQLNERILTGLRTIEGINCVNIKRSFGIDLIKERGKLLKELFQKNLLKVQNERIRLEPEGFLVADEIALKLFFHE